MYGHKNMHSTNKNDKHSASFSERFLFRKFHAALALFGNIQHNHHSRGGWLKSKHPVASTQRPPLHDYCWYINIITSGMTFSLSRQSVHVLNRFKHLLCFLPYGVIIFIMREMFSINWERGNCCPVCRYAKYCDNSCCTDDIWIKVKVSSPLTQSDFVQARSFRCR